MLMLRKCVRKRQTRLLIKRMKLAGKLLAENKKDVFYDESLEGSLGIYKR